MGVRLPAAVVVVLLMSGTAAAQDPFSVVQQLNQRLLESRSATATLESWCRDYRLAPAAAIVARVVKDADRAATPDQRKRLDVTATERVAYRRVELRCGDRTLSEADNWYVPGRLTPEMNRALETTDTPFGTIVRPLEPYRVTFSVRFLIPPSATPVPDAVLEHQAVLYTKDHRPFSEVREVYQRQVLPNAASAQRGTAGGEWRSHGGDQGSTKYSPVDQITRDNVVQLRVAWRRPAVDDSLQPPGSKIAFSNDFRATPLMIGGVLYSANGIGLVEAFHPGTGKTLWVQQRLPEESQQPLRGNSTRAIAYWSAGGDERLFVIRGEYLIALDLRTGAPVASWGTNGRVHLKPGLGPRATTYSSTSGPQVCGDVVMTGANMTDAPQSKVQPPGNVQAFDVRTGKPRWVFHPIPGFGEAGVETWEKDSWAYSGNANLWSLMSADEELGLAYLPMTSPTGDMYGGHRLGDNLFSDSLVAVKCATGERAWHYQVVHHDLWDYDLPAAPVLADITVGGRRIKAIVQVTKQAFAFVFDRTNGQPVWPIEERPVPTSDTPGERTSPTQPFPTKPPPFDRQGVSADDLIDFTPALRAQALELVKQYRIGPLFTPPSIRGEGPGATRGTVQLPGSVGGADWQGGAFDPETGMFYVESITGPFVADLVKGDPARTDFDYVPGLRAYPPGPERLPLLKPPYGRVTAIDLNAGDIAWTAANGDGPRDHPLLAPLKLPPLGNPGRGGLLATKTLLFVGEGDPVMVRAGSRLRPEMPLSIAPGAGGKKFRAFDKKTGAILWETELPAGTTGAPMTYVFEGKQYIVVAIGGLEHPAEFIALALP